MSIKELNEISELELNKENIYRKIRNTECSTKIFGDCEICHKPVVEVYHQQIFRWGEYSDILKKKLSKLCFDNYGHLRCLESVWSNSH